MTFRSVERAGPVYPDLPFPARNPQKPYCFSGRNGPPGKRSGEKESEEKIKKINYLVNGLNIKLHKALRRDDTSFVSRTTLESTRYRPQDIVVLRAVLMNPLINRKVLEEIVDTQNRIGLKIWKEFEPAYRKMINGR